MLKRVIAAVTTVALLAQPGLTEQFIKIQSLNLPKMTKTLRKSFDKLPLPKKKAVPQKLKMQLVLSEPNDLKVYPGSYVEPGTLIMDRTGDRTRLESQLKELNFNYKNVSSQVLIAPIKPKIPELPPITYAIEEASVIESTKKIELVGEKIQQQTNKINSIKSLPLEELPESIIEHEQAIAAQLIRESKEAELNLEVAKAKLKSAQEQRQYEVYNREMEISKIEQVYRNQLETYSNNRQNKEYQLSQIWSQIQFVQNQLSKIGKVKSDYYAQVSKIKYETQNNEGILISLTLDIDGTDTPRFDIGSDKPGTPKPRGTVTTIKPAFKATDKPTAL